MKKEDFLRDVFLKQSANYQELDSFIDELFTNR